MLIFIGIIGIGLAVWLLIKYQGELKSLSLDRGSMFKAQSNVVVCPYCKTEVKRQKHGQQCPKCRKYF